jgi:micrococcal nuclease
VTKNEKATMLKKNLILPVILVLLCAPVFAETFTGKCVGVTDGDTITVMKDRMAVKIRLEGIDCPEKGQPFGTRAKKLTSSLAYGKHVTVKTVTVDRYGRIVARVIAEGKDLSVKLVKAGLAWHYKHFSHDRVLAEAEQEARQKKRGLWAMPDPVPPWDYRRKNH